MILQAKVKELEDDPQICSDLLLEPSIEMPEKTGLLVGRTVNKMNENGTV
jgi:hypothetical protein